MLKTALLLLAAAAPSWSQMGMMGMRPPDMPGLFKPLVGAGATYRITTARQPNTEFTFAIVGKEGEAYWLEIRTSAGNGAVIKQLMPLGDGGRMPQAQRMIVQAAGRPPMEIPVNMMNGAMAQAQARTGSGAGAGLGAKISSETITVPAGTFECDHYSSTYNGKTADVWISSKVSPYGLVKMKSDDSSMELQAVLDHETSKITAEPMKMPFPGR